MGVHYIHIDRKGKRVSKLLVSNHITAMDSFILAWVEHTRCVICDEFFQSLLLEQYCERFNFWMPLRQFANLAEIPIMVGISSRRH
eukprot:UN27804